MLEHALEYASRGIPVFPCRSQTIGEDKAKSPLTPHGFKDATADTCQIEAWWTQWPDALIGMPTSGLVVIDVDPLPDGSANPWPGEAWADFGPCPTATTPRGGRHYYFQSKTDIGCSTGKVAPGVDVRASGGYVILPPSQTDVGAYRWVVDLDEQIPALPGWLEDQIVNPERKPIGQSPDGLIPQGHRNQSLASLAGHLRQIGCTEGEIAALLLRANVERCRPALPIAEVEKIAWSIARKEPDQGRTAAAWDHYGQDRVKEPLIRVMTSAEFDDAEFPLEYLVDGFLAANQPAVLGASKKTLKTMILEDIGINLAAGHKVLGAFPVSKPVPVILLSGESGGATLQRNARTIADVSGVRLRDLPLFWSLDLPQLHHADHMVEFESAIKSNGIRLAAVDPLYLCLLSSGNAAQASNVYAMGNAFRRIGDIGQQNDCTILLVHHFKQSHRDDQHTMPSLDDLSYAGISEFVRQWILLRRRKKYQPGGMHYLWLTVGGSAGHSGEWELDIDEGDGKHLTGGKRWLVKVAEREQEKEEPAKGRKRDSEKARYKILSYLASKPHGASKSGIKEGTHMRDATCRDMLDALVAEGLITPVQHARQHSLFQLTLLGDQELKQHAEFMMLSENQNDSGDYESDE